MAAIATAPTTQSTDTAQSVDINGGAAPTEAAGLRGSEQQALAAQPLEQDPKQDPKPSVEQQLANMQKQIDEMKAMIKSIAENNSIPAEARLQAIQAALNAPVAQGAPAPVAAAPTAPVVPPAAKQEEKVAESKPAAVATETKPAVTAETKPAPAGNDPFAGVDAVAAKAAPQAAKPADPTAALDSVQAAPSKAPEQKSSLSIDPLAALENVIPIRRTVEDAKKAVDTVTGAKPAPEAKADPKPEVKPEVKPEPKAEVKVETKTEVKPAPAAKVETSLTPELLAKAQTIGNTLADDFSRTSYDYGKITQKAELAAVKEKMDPETRKRFNEEIARTFAERAIRANERDLTDFNERSSGSDIERNMRYAVMGRILGGGDPQKGNGQAGAMLKEVASERMNELLAEKSTHEDGPARVKTIEGLARRFSVEKPVEGIKTEKQEIRESALEEFKAVLGADIDAKQRDRLLEGIVDKANKGIDVFSKNLLTEKDLAPIFAEHINEEVEKSRSEGIQKRRARLNELTDLADNFDVEDEPQVKSALDAMKLEISAELLDKGIDELLNDKKLSWSKTADGLRELRDEAVDMSGVKKEEANRVIEEKLKAWVASREVQSLAHAHEINDGIDMIDHRLGLSDKATEEMKGAVRADVIDRLDAVLAEERKKVDEILLSEKNGVSLDGKEREARSYIADVAKVGDEKLAQEIKVRLGAHAVETILEGEIKNKVDFETRADEAEDLAHYLGIKDEAAQVVAKVAEKRFGRQPESEQEIATMKEELYELMEESYLRPQDTRDSKSELKKDATQRLVELDKQLDEKLVAIQESAREKARLAAEARVAKAHDEIKAVLGNDDVSIDKRITEVKKIQQSAGLPAGEVKKIVEAKIDELAGKNDRKSTANAALLARGFGVEML